MRNGETAGIEEVVARALVEAESARGRRYYDAERDAAAGDEYFAGIRLGDPGGVSSSLVALLEKTHLERPAYRPSLEVYPWVDLHPDGFLHSIYSGEPFAPAGARLGNLPEVDAEGWAARGPYRRDHHPGT